jgi:hypothetical protein
VDVVFEGALSKSWGMGDVLHAVSSVENLPFGILRITSPGSNVSGRLAISQGKYIVGATAAEGQSTTTEAQEHGYSAVRKLLAARDGNFAFLDTGGAPMQDFSDSLYISIEKVMTLLDRLPDNPADLFDEKSLLDQVFGGTHIMLAKPVTPIALPVVEQLQIKQEISQSMAVPVAAWNVGNPATPPVPVSVGERLTAAEEELDFSPDYELQDTAAHKESLIRLRSNDQPEAKSSSPWLGALVRDSFSGRSAPLWIMVLLILVLSAATLFGSGVLNDQPWLTILKIRTGLGPEQSQNPSVQATE